jgi:deazaflavin-dependent oxidoreductase (nitroreductase family)
MWDSSRVFSDRTATRLSTSIGDRGLRLAGKLNVPLYRVSRGRLFGNMGGSPVVLLTTTGRKSGEQRTAPVIFMRAGESLVVIGSNAGYKRTPAWSLNLKANPNAEVQVKGDRWPVRARVAEGEERAELWKSFTAQYSGFDDYDARTARDISVFVLERRDGS